MRKIFFYFHILFLLGIASNTSAQIDTDIVQNMGIKNLVTEEYVEAISNFNKIIRVKPYLPFPYYLRAHAKFNLDDLKGAERDMDKAIEISPFHHSFFTFRGDIKMEFGAIENAIDDYNEGLLIKPNNIDILFKRGIAFMSLNDYEKSSEDFSLVIELDNARYGAYINRGLSKMQLNDTIGAIQDMDMAIEINPLVSTVYRFSAKLYYDLNKFDTALSRMDEAIRLKDDDADYYVLRAIIRYQIDDLKGTMADFDKVIELEPKNALAYSNRGLLRTEVGDINNAIDDYSRVLALNPSDLLTLFNRSLLYIRVGQYTDALSDLNIIINKYPEYSTAYKARAEAYLGLQDEVAAGKDYGMAFKLDQDQRKKSQDKVNNQVSKKPKETRSEKDEDISNHGKIAVLDDFGIEEAEVEDIEDLKGKVQNRNIVIDLETMYGLTFFSVDSLINRTRYFKPAITQFNQRKKFGRPLVFSNREAENDGEKALEYFTTIKEVGEDLKDDPQSADLRFTRAILYGVVLNYSSAISEYDDILKGGTTGSVELFSYFNRAYIRYKMVEMMQTFTEEELPANLMTKPLLSNTTKKDTKKDDGVIRQMLDYNLIERDLRKVLELDPKFEFAYYNLGILQCIRKDYEGAVENFNKAIELNPFFAEAYFNRGLTNIYLKKDEEGTLDLSKAGELGLYKAYNVIKRYGMQRIEGEEGKEEEKEE